MAHYNFRQASSDWTRINNMYPSNQHQHQYDPANPHHVTTQRIHPQPQLHPHPTGPVYRDAPQHVANRLHPPPQPHHHLSNSNSPFINNAPLTYSGQYDWRNYAPPPPPPGHYNTGQDTYPAYQDQSNPHPHVHGQPYSYPTAMSSYRSLPLPYDENTNSGQTSAMTATAASVNGSIIAPIPVLGSGPLKPLTTGAINSLMAHLGNAFQAPKEEDKDHHSPFTTSKQLDDPDTKPSEPFDPDFAPDTDQIPDAEADDENYIPTTTRKVARKVKTKAKAGKKGKAKGKGKGKAAISSGKKPSVSSTFATSPFPDGQGGSTTTFNAVAGPSSLRHSNHPSTSTSATHLQPGPPQSMGDEEIFRDLKNVQYPLMPIPEGSFSDVNDLLILHPPSHSPARKAHKPINQYSRGDEPIPHAGQSKWEMYTCRSCRKTYDGKNARSVARRHLQDKHGIPLSKQARRTRWDHDESASRSCEVHG